MSGEYLARIIKLVPSEDYLTKIFFVKSNPNPIIIQFEDAKLFYEGQDLYYSYGGYITVKINQSFDPKFETVSLLGELVPCIVLNGGQLRIFLYRRI